MTYNGSGGRSPVVKWRPLRGHSSTAGEKVNAILEKSGLPEWERQLAVEEIIRNTMQLVDILQRVNGRHKRMYETGDQDEDS